MSCMAETRPLLRLRVHSEQVSSVGSICLYSQSVKRKEEGPSIHNIYIYIYIYVYIGVLLEEIDGPGR